MDKEGTETKIDQLEASLAKLSSSFPLSPLFPIKKTIALWILFAFLVAALLFGGEEFHSYVLKLRAALNLEGLLIYYIALPVCYAVGVSIGQAKSNPS